MNTIKLYHPSTLNYGEDSDGDSDTKVAVIDKNDIV